MNDKVIIDILKEYLKNKCDYINDLKIDYLDSNKSWSLEQVGRPVQIKKDVTGNRKMQLIFILATRIPVNSVTDENQKKILKIFSDISEWMYQSTQNKILPMLNDDEEAELLESTGNAYLVGVNNDRTEARYEMPCKFIYKKKREPF